MINIIFLLSLLSLSLGDDPSSCSNSVIPGPFTWTLNNAPTTSYIIQAGGTNSWGSVSTSSSTVTSGLGPRYYLANSCANGFSSNVFQKINPLGSTFSFTVDLSTVGCGQNAAFYLVGMPASGSGSIGDYYCDANCVGGSCCTEMDIMEANRHALQITPHKCSSADSGCDGGGCARNTQSITNGYGPSSSYQINTLIPFQLSITFETTNDQLSSIVSIISQGSNSITLTHDDSCGSNYLQAMTPMLSTGMVSVWSFWSGSMSWLDSPACSSDSSETSNPKFIFSSLVVSSAGSMTSLPPPPPVPPASQHCGNQGCNTNAFWVEFTSPSGSSSSPSPYVLCTGGVQFPCNWDGNSKWQCSGSTPCSSPVPYVNGKLCPILSSALGDQTAQSSEPTFNTETIAIIVVGSIIAVLLIVLIVVLVITRKRTEEYV